MIDSSEFDNDNTPVNHLLCTFCIDSVAVFWKLNVMPLF